MSGSPSRLSRYPVVVRARVSAVHLEALRSHARATDVSLSAALRQLLSANALTEQPLGDGTVEQALLMLRDLLPEGSMRSAQAREQAVLAAEWRLAELRESLKERS